jgi:hypothetical protein
MHTQPTAVVIVAEPLRNKRRHGRSKSTNNVGFVLRKPLTPFQAARRQRDLVDAFVAALGGSVSELVAVQIRKAAELLTMAEGIRGGALGGTPQTSGDLMALIRIEGEARRCLKTLGIKVEPAPARAGGLALARQRWSEAEARAEKAKPAGGASCHSPAPQNPRTAVSEAVDTPAEPVDD